MCRSRCRRSLSGGIESGMIEEETLEFLMILAKRRGAVP
jgi:hypothetical protein